MFRSFVYIDCSAYLSIVATGIPDSYNMADRSYIHIIHDHACIYPLPNLTKGNSVDGDPRT